MNRLIPGDAAILEFPFTVKGKACIVELTLSADVNARDKDNHYQIDTIKTHGGGEVGSSLIYGVFSGAHMSGEFGKNQLDKWIENALKELAQPVSEAEAERKRGRPRKEVV